MANKFQNYNLKRRFERNNPSVGADVVDFSVTSKDGDYDENLALMKEDNPQFNWGDAPNYDAQAKEYVRVEAAKFGLEVNNYDAAKKAERLESENHRLRQKIVLDKTVKFNVNKAFDIEEFWEAIINDIKQTHITVNAEAGHGKSQTVKNIIAELKRRDPKLICKAFDISFAWWDNAPLKYRQKITLEKIQGFIQGNSGIHNLGDCVYEMGDLNEDMRRIFVALIVKMDYDVRRRMRELYGEEEFKKLPRIVYILEEADTFFDSASLNRKDEASEVLRDFIKVGRNFGLRAFCIVTANVGELGTKLRRRSKHLIGRIISEADLKEYDRKFKTLGTVALSLERFWWIYYNGEKVVGPFYLEDNITASPVDYVHRLPDGKVENINIEVGKNRNMSRTSSTWKNVVLFFFVILFLIFLFL